MSTPRPRSDDLFDEARDVLVGGTPVFVDHASGAEIIDADGNQYIDLVCRWARSSPDTPSRTSSPPSATLRLTDQPGFHARLHDRTTRLVVELISAARHAGVPLAGHAVGGMFGVAFAEVAPTSPRPRRTVFGGLDDADARACVECERAFMRAAGGAGKRPVAAIATLHSDGLHLRGQVFGTDDADIVNGDTTGDDPIALGEGLAARLAEMLGGGP